MVTCLGIQQPDYCRGGVTPPLQRMPIIALGVLALLALTSCQKSSNEPSSPFPQTQQIASYGSLPRWSPDGQKLAFGGDGAQMGIWVYNRSTGSLTQVTDADYPHLYDYRWSNSSDQIAFGGAGASIENTSGIFTVGLDGSDPVRWHETGHSPGWIPGDSGLVFAEEDPQSGNYGLFKLIFADTSLTRLTYSGIDPQYSPTGVQIAYRDLLGAGTAVYQLKIMTASGATTNILVDTCANYNWTQGGSTIVFNYATQRPGTTLIDMWISQVPAIGGAVTHIVPDAIESSVSSSGRIVYQSIYGDLSQGIYGINLDGSDLQPISDAGYQPAITPDGSVIAFAKDDGIWAVGL